MANHAIRGRMNELQIRTALSPFFVDANTVAAILECSPQTVINYVDKGLLTAAPFVPGTRRRTVRIKSESVRKMIGIEDDEQEVVTTAS